MQSRQTMTQASQMAAHTLRDGDRGSPGAAPTLKDKDE
jgi:type IV secretion system protein TrbL